MPIDLSKSLEDMLRELEWNPKKAQEIPFGDIARLRSAEYGHFKYVLGKERGDDAYRFAQFIGIRHDVALFLETIRYAEENPFWHLVNNALKRGNLNDSTKKIELECYYTPKGFLVIVRDEGEGFDAAEVVRKQEAGERYYIDCGTGFHFMAKEQTCTYSYSKKGNEAYILCLAANAKKADRTKIYPVYFPEILDVPTNTEART